jgi:hypothetical protein
VILGSFFDLFLGLNWAHSGIVRAVPNSRIFGYFRVLKCLPESPIWVLANMPKMAKSTSENMRDGQKRDLFWGQMLWRDSAHCYQMLWPAITRVKAICTGDITPATCKLAVFPVEGVLRQIPELKCELGGSTVRDR